MEKYKSDLFMFFYKKWLSMEKYKSDLFMFFIRNG